MGKNCSMWYVPPSAAFEELKAVAKLMAQSNSYMDSEITSVLTPLAAEAARQDKAALELLQKHSWDADVGYFRSPLHMERFVLDLRFHF